MSTNPSSAAGGPRDYDHLFKLLIIGDSGMFLDIVIIVYIIFSSPS